jgi:hypothetical protein
MAGRRAVSRHGRGGPIAPVSGRLPARAEARGCLNMLARQFVVKTQSLESDRRIMADAH